MKQQIDQRDCSIYVFEHFANKYYGDSIDINELKLNIIYDVNGISLKNLQDLIKKFSYQLQSFKCNSNDFEKIDNSEYPFAAIVNNNNMSHMVLIKQRKENKLIIYDPQIGESIILINEFLKTFAEIIICFQKTSQHITKEIKTHNKFQWKGMTLSFKLIGFYLLQILVSLITPLTSKYVFEAIIPYHLKIELWIMTGFFVVMFLLSILIQIMLMRIFELKFLKKYNQKFQSLIQTWISENIKLINKLNSIEIKNRINSLSNYLVYKQTFLSKIIVNLISLILALIIILSINKQLLIIVACFGIITSLFSFIFIQWYNKYKNIIINDAQQRDKDMDNYINLLKNNFESNLINFLQSNLLNNYTNHILMNSSFNIQMQNFNYFELFLDVFYPFCILIYGAYQVWNNNLQIYQLLFFITASNLFIKPLKFIPEAFKMYKDYRIVTSLLKIFNAPSKQENLDLYLDKITKIQLSYVSFSYHNDPNFNTINIPRMILNNKHIISGNNGCGKTTLCNILSGKYQNDFGEILINDVPMNLHKNFNIREKIYYIGDKAEKLDMSIAEYLMIKDIQIFQQIMLKFKLHSILEAASLNDIKNTNINSLSSGQLQIIKILRLFLNDYDVIMLDEAFESLSEEIFKILKIIIYDLLKDKIVLEISHNHKYIFNNAEVIQIEKVQN